MAPWDRDNKPQNATDSSRSGTEEENPFIAFRKFADEQINTLIHTFNAIPGWVAEAKAAEEERQKRERSHSEHKWNQEEAGVNPWQRVDWPSSKMEHGHETQEDDSHVYARILLRQARNGNVGVDPKKLIALFRDEGSNTIKLDEDGYATLVTSPAWLSVDWFKDSAYSPIQVEQHLHTHQQGSMWRAAFEDLLSAELGKEQKAWPAWTGRVNNQKLYSNWAEIGMDWMLGLQCRGILPPQLPQLYNMPLHDARIMDTVLSDLMRGRWTLPIGFGAVRDFNRLAREILCEAPDSTTQMHDMEKTDTELDVYESMMAAPQSSQPTKENLAAQNVAHHERQSLPTQRAEHDGGGVLSSLTTTETVTLPDGTTTTKVVLKKRFRDGREESTETISTIHGQRQQSTSASTAAPLQTPGYKADNEVKKDGSSWFWS